MLSSMRGVSDREDDAASTVGSSIIVPEWVTPAEAAFLAGTSEEAVAQAIAEAQVHAWSSKDGARSLISSAELTTVLFPADGSGPRLPDFEPGPPADTEYPTEAWVPAPDPTDVWPLAPRPPEGSIAVDTAPPGEAVTFVIDVDDTDGQHVQEASDLTEAAPRWNIPDRPDTSEPGAGPEVGEVQDPVEKEESSPAAGRDADEAFGQWDLPGIHDADEARVVDDEVDFDRADGEHAIPRPRRRRARRVWGLVVLLVAAGAAAKLLLPTGGDHPSAGSAAVATTPPAVPEAGPSNATPDDPTPSPVDTALVFPDAPAFDTPVFVQHGRWVTAVATIANANEAYWLPSISVTFVVRDQKGNVLAKHDTRVSVPPLTSVRLVAPDMTIHPKSATAVSVRLEPGLVGWAPPTSLFSSGLEVAGSGFSSSGPGDLTVVASVSNTGTARESGRLVCVVEDAAGGLTGAAEAMISLRPGQAKPIPVPVPRPAAGSHHADCEIVPEGR
jgi:hypothetical protein